MHSAVKVVVKGAPNVTLRTWPEGEIERVTVALPVGSPL